MKNGSGALDQPEAEKQAKNSLQSSLIRSLSGSRDILLATALCYIAAGIVQYSTGRSYIGGTLNLLTFLLLGVGIIQLGEKFASKTLPARTMLLVSALAWLALLRMMLTPIPNGFIYIGVTALALSTLALGSVRFFVEVRFGNNTSFARTILLVSAWAYFISLALLMFTSGNSFIGRGLSLLGLLTLALGTIRFVIEVRKEKKRSTAPHEDFSFDRDKGGAMLPTLRNNKIFQDLFDKYKSVDPLETMEKLKEVTGDNYMQHVIACTFDPRKENVVFDTEELARKGKERADLINRLDKEWLASNEGADPNMPKSVSSTDNLTI